MESNEFLGSLTPELDVTDMAKSIAFYALLGFGVAYERTEEGFSYLAGPGCSFMLQKASGPGRRFRTAQLERPFGRGVNFQVEVTDVEGAYRRVVEDGHEVVVPLEERWYRVGAIEAGNLQFVVADPDGYLIRPFTSLDARGA